MEDSGYFSHSSSEFKFSSATGGSSGRIPSPEDLFSLSFEDLNSAKYGRFKYGFTDEDDFEDFKRELQDFRRLKREAKDEGLLDDESLSSEERSRGNFRSKGGKSTDSIKVSDTTVHVSVGERRNEREETTEEGARGWGVAAAGNGVSSIRVPNTLGDEDPPRYTPQVKRSISLRSYGDNAGARGAECVKSKRNGVYFDENCFLGSSNSRKFDTKLSRDAHGGKNLDTCESDPSSGVNTDLFSLSEPVERKGAKKVSFYEHPETFSLIAEPRSSSRDFPVNFEPSSSSNNLTSRLPTETFKEDFFQPGGNWNDKDELNSPQNSFSPNDSATFSTCSEGRSSPGEKKTRQEQWSQPVVIPIKLVSFPVSRHHSGVVAGETAFERRANSKAEISQKTPVTIPAHLKDSPKRDSIGTSEEPPRTAIQREGTDVQGSGHRQAYNPKRSSLLENLRRFSGHGRPGSGRGLETFMEFFSGDEHFQEFERVFETINNHRFSRDMDSRRSGNWWQQDGSEEDPFGEDDDDLGVHRIDETFLDFFDNDEDFMEFERELEKIKSNRRSKLLDNLNRRSSCDIFSDMKSFCDKNLNKSRTPSSSPKVVRRLSATNSADSELWNSAEEWGLVMNKLKRNSRMFSDQSRDSSLACRAVDGSLSKNTLAPDTAGHSEQCSCFRDCQYTCHSQCVPSVTLDCTTVSPGSGGGPIATPTDLPSPSASAETSLTDRRTVVTHRSPQKQQQPPAYELAARVAPQSAQHLLPSSGASVNSSQAQNVSSLSTAEDPLSGTYVSQSSSSSGVLLSSAASLCVERDLNQNAKTVDANSVVEYRVLEDVCDTTNEKDETDSGYRSGTIPDEKLPKAPSQATLNRKELRRKIETFNHYVPKASLETVEDGESFQGFLRVTLNLIRPITMELGARPPSIYELLTREHIVEQSTQHIAFYMPRDTVKSIHITSKTTTKEVITGLLKKFHILDHPRKFAMYEQEFNEKNKLVKLRRLTDKDYPLVAMLTWEPERIKYYRLVLQENETGEIVWDAFSAPELKNFMIVLDREESEAIVQLQYKYRVMKRIIHQRMKELRKERQLQTESAT